MALGGGSIIGTFDCGSVCLALGCFDGKNSRELGCELVLDGTDTDCSGDYFARVVVGCSKQEKSDFGVTKFVGKCGDELDSDTGNRFFGVSRDTERVNPAWFVGDIFGGNFGTFLVVYQIKT